MEQGHASRLVGWKRIAAHLGCSERTARRWEREEDLPVHRQQHEKRSTVYAVATELDAWFTSRSQQSGTAELAQSPGRSPGALVAAALILVLLVVAAVVLLPRSESPGNAGVATMSADPIAVDLYERGRELWRQRGEVPNGRAIKLLTEAVERDDRFAEAWAALASAWLTYPTYADDMPLDRAVDEALLAADRAVQLNPGLAEPRSVMASIAQRQGDWLRSERIYRDALVADPDNTSLMLWFAGHYRELGMIQKTQQLTRSALDLDPNSPPILTEIAMNQNALGDLEDSMRRLDYLWFDLGVETPVVWIGRWFGLTELGDFDAALAWIERSPFSSFKPELRRYVERQRDAGPNNPDAFAGSIVAAYEAGLPAWLAYHLLDQSGEPSAALGVLDQESANGTFDTSVVLFYPRGGSARSSERFVELVDRLGYMEYWRANGAPDICRDEPATPLCAALSSDP
ncbi:MAG: hypothetical protein AAFS02_05970 [Pseudomonadota bacterium]